MIEQLESRLLLAAGPRQMEYLGRGVVATRPSSSQVFVSWRSMALDPAGMGFNVYRSANGGAATKLNPSPLTAGTNYTDSTASNSSATYSYFVKPVVSGVEQAASDSYTLPANSPSQPMFSVSLRNIGDYHLQHVSVGDLDGDGEYDFVVGRIPNQSGMTERFEAYRRDGTFLWSVDCGPNSLDLDNIEPGSSAIDVGNWDGVTVYDLDGDGKAEVFYRSANGVVFGDGTTLSNSNDNVQYISVLNGMTGAERARIQIPADYISDGPLACSLGVGYLDGVHPSVVAKLKNRIGAGDFNIMYVAYDFNGGSISQKWKWLGGSANAEFGHQIRIVDVDQNGTDEIVDSAGVNVLNGDGTLKYSMAPTVGHGDRFHIGDLDPDRPGLEGYGIQQNNPSGLVEYYYDAATGQILHQHFTTPLVDNGRGIVADIDPNYRGYEYWSFYGIYNSNTPVAGQAPVETKITDEPNRPWPNFRVWWDGDVLGENLNSTVIDKWNPATQSTDRVTTLYHYGSPIEADREAPVFYGDIIGDWREEVIFERSDHTALNIYTTQIASSTRIYTLAQDPEYRNCMTVKGYYQSNMLDYYLGSGMATPPTPNITMHAATTVIVPPPAPTNLGASVVSAAGSTQVNLSWTAATGATSYKVRRSPTDGGPYAVVGTTTGTSFSDSNLLPNGGSCYYVVTQINGAAAESTPSNQAGVTIGQPPTSNTYQAENGTLSGGATVASNASGYAGTGFVDFPSNNGVLQLDNVDGGGGGVATFTFRYAMGASGTRSGTFTVNGVSQGVTFSWTGAWNTWETLKMTANVTPGASNTIQLRSTGQDLANIDQVQVDVAAPPFMYAGGAGGDQYYIRRNGATIDVWVNGNGSGTPTYRLIHASTPSLSFSGGGGNDVVTVDSSAGNPIPAGGMSFSAGDGIDTLNLMGSSAIDAVSVSSSQISFNGSIISLSALETRTYSSGGGADNLSINGGSVSFNSSQQLGQLLLTSGASAAIAAGGNKHLQLNTLSIDGTSRLDLGDNDLVVNNGNFSDIRSLMLAGFGNSGGPGIISSTSDGSEILALFDNALVGASEWDGQTIGANAIVGKYTYFGDVNFDGQVTGDDYTIIDSNLNTTPPVGLGWLSGDANLDGLVTGDDYTTIDSNLGLGSGNPLAAMTGVSLPQPLRLRDHDLLLESAGEVSDVL